MKGRVLSAMRRVGALLLSGKLHEDGDGDDDDEVKDCEFVHLLAHPGLPALPTNHRHTGSVSIPEN